MLVAGLVVGLDTGRHCGERRSFGSAGWRGPLVPRRASVSRRWV